MQFYSELKLVHMGAALSSGAFFFLRALAVQFGARWPLAAIPSYVSYTIDTVLLTAALMLWTMLPGAMFANGWLATKLVLVVAYIVLGSLAVRRGRTAMLRRACFVAATIVFALIYGIARAHDPRGWWLLR